MNKPVISRHVLFVFLDGVGLGSEDEHTNPFFKCHLPAFSRLSNGRRWTRSIAPIEDSEIVFKGIDATLQMPGLPQSGTGQATLFTGANCALLAGRHYGPYPHSKTKPTISSYNIFQQVKGLHLPHAEPNAFANAYPKQFFEKAKARSRWTVTTLSCIEADVKIRTLSELEKTKPLRQT